MASIINSKYWKKEFLSNGYATKLDNLAYWSNKDREFSDLYNDSVVNIAMILLNHGKYYEFNTIYNYYREKNELEYKIDELSDELDYAKDDLENWQTHEYNDMVIECDSILEYDSGDWLDNLEHDEKISLGVE